MARKYPRDDGDVVNEPPTRTELATREGFLRAHVLSTVTPLCSFDGHHSTTNTETRPCWAHHQSAGWPPPVRAHAQTHIKPNASLFGDRYSAEAFMYTYVYKQACETCGVNGRLGCQKPNAQTAKTRTTTRMIGDTVHLFSRSSCDCDALTLNGVKLGRQANNYWCRQDSVGERDAGG